MTIARFGAPLLAGALFFAAGAASAQMPASSPNSGVDKPSNSGIGAVQPPGSTSPGYGATTGSVVPVQPPVNGVPAVDPDFSRPTPTGSAGNSNTGPGGTPYRP